MSMPLTDAVGTVAPQVPGLGGAQVLAVGTGRTARWQAARRVALSPRSAGRSTRQRSMAIGQRGWKAQPAGRSIGLGISPARRGVTRRVGSGRGADASSARV